MTAIRLAQIAPPELEIPEARPSIPAETYARRCDAAYARAGRDWLAVYADREHLANVAFLTGFDPRFEEALFLLGPDGRKILLVGNESWDYAPLAGLRGFDRLLCQAFSLMGQDRTQAPSLEAVLREAGLARGQTVGVVGWKYFEDEEREAADMAFFLPAFVVAALARVAGGPEALSDATAVLMHPGDGLRAVVDADEIAACEWAASRASAAVWRIVRGAREGDSELLAAGRMGYAGEALSCHVMMSCGDAADPVVGLASPTARRLKRGDGVTTAVGYWGGLSSRAGLLDRADDDFLKVAAGYFAGLLAWYATADIGVAGGDLYAQVEETLARAGLRPALNPGHLVSYDEWSHTPVRRGGRDVLASGMPFQVDVIPVPQRAGRALNCEDTVAFADADLRAEIARRHPAVWGRIETRRAFLRERIGVDLKSSILPLSNIPLCLPPFWLSAGDLLTAG